MLKLKLFNPKTGESQETVLNSEMEPQYECLIGRAASCHLVLDSVDVSRVHGRIQLHKGEYFYTDLGSANGSLLNAQEMQVNRNYRLNLEDQLCIGDFGLRIADVAAAAGDRRQWSKGNLTVRCVRIVQETADVKTFTFVADSPVLFNYQPGQFVTLELEIDGEPVSRSYSISSSPSRPQTLEITVKRVPPPVDAPDAPAGLVSNWLHDRLTVGSQVKLSGPLGKFTCCPDPAQKLLLISAGSGITPMMSMSRWLTDTVANSDVVFFHSARTPQDIIFRQELELIATRFPMFRLAVSITQPGQPWFGFTGRLNAALLQQIAPDFQERRVYVCGPDGFMQDVKRLFEELGFPMQNYAQESFGVPKKARRPEGSATPQPESSSPAPRPVPAPAPAAVLPVLSPPPSASPIVHFSQSSKQVAGSDGESILELAEQAGVKIRSSCRQGVCGACKKRKLDGEIRYDEEPDGLDASDRAAGCILPCVAYPVGRVTIEA